MRFLKPLAIVLAVLFAILILNSMIETYRWDKRIVEEMNKQGFELISQTTGSAPIVPWTLFYPYVTHITLVHPDSIKPFKDFIAADVISFNKNDRGGVGVVAQNCALRLRLKAGCQSCRSAGRYETQIFRPDGVQVKKWWFEMNDQMNGYFCKNRKVPR